MRSVRAVLNLPLARLEPLAALLLTAHGTAVLAVDADAPWQPALLIAYGALAVASLMLPRASSNRLLTARVVATIAVSAIMQAAFTAGGDYFLLWYFVAVSVYPLRLSTGRGLALSAVVAATYAALVVRHHDPATIEVARALTLLLLGLIITGSARALREATAQQQRAHAQLDTVFNAITYGIALYDREMRFVHVNDALARINGRSAQAHLGVRLSDLLPDLPAAIERAFRHVLETGEPVLDLVVDASTPGIPASRTYRSSWYPVRENGEITGVGVIVRDVTETRRAEARLAWAATHDALTALPNRALFLDRLKHALARSRRGPGTVAVLFTDLDRFKVVNDSLGHEVGDTLLRALAGRLSGAVRPGDTVARFGGDEFALLCESVRDRREAEAIAARLLAVVGEPVEVAGRMLRITPSIGVALAERCVDAEPHALLRAADAAMYHAKEHGKARWAVFDEGMRADAAARLEREQALHAAISERSIRVAFQPVFDLRTLQVTHVEALARWRHGDTDVPPAQFVALAEDIGVVRPLGREVLMQACAHAARWTSDSTPVPVLNVNVGAAQLAHPGLRGDVGEALERSGLPPDRLCIEITETAMMTDVEHSLAVLWELRELGVGVALDDFGVGYSSLSSLRRLPVTLIKIDRSFVQDPGVAGVAERLEIVPVAVSLARALRAGTVAEGIETEAQLDAVRSAGCDYAQGFLLGRPQDPAGLSLAARSARGRIVRA